MSKPHPLGLDRPGPSGLWPRWAPLVLASGLGLVGPACGEGASSTPAATGGSSVAPISGGAGGQVETGASGASTSGGSVSPGTGGTLASTGGASPGSGGSSPAGGGSSGSSSGGLLGASGQTGGSSSEVGGFAGMGGSSSGGTRETGGVHAGGASTGGSAGAGAGAGGTAAGGGGGQGGENNCNLPATVSFQQEVQPFLIPSCGGGNGCHVIDDASTTANGGFNHAYDWITAGSHDSSCPTTPFRFEIVIDVINGANPPSCENSRKMPPPDGDDVRTPLTPCQVATLQAWLDEPTVVQTHRADDTSPTTPYAMPPFN